MIVVSILAMSDWLPASEKRRGGVHLQPFSGAQTPEVRSR